MTLELTENINKKKEILYQLMDMVATTPVEHILKVYRQGYATALWFLRNGYRHEAHHIYDALDVTTDGLVQEKFFGKEIEEAIASLKHIEQRSRQEIEYETRYQRTRATIDRGISVLDMFAHRHDPYCRDIFELQIKRREPYRSFM